MEINMGIKDWILLIVPIMFNGLIVLFIEICFENKKIKREVKIPCYKEFSNIIKEFNLKFI